MSPKLATLICILFILYLFWVDRKKGDDHSNALWIPLIWMLIAGSRFVSHWLNLLGLTVQSGVLVRGYEDGSPIDSIVFSVLILAGVFVLFKREINWDLVWSKNKLIWLYFCYCGISTLWSDNPFLSFKRLIKDSGNLIIILVILSEKHPYEAAGLIFRRFAFLTMPLSILFIKYYPFGRDYAYMGGTMYTGVAGQKNTLGLNCFISGTYFVWNLLFKQEEDIKLQSKDNIIDFMFLCIIAWLLYLSHSATSTAVAVVTISLFFMSHTKLMIQNPGRIILWMTMVAFLYIGLDATLDIKNLILNLLGRDATLTNRTNIWQIAETMSTNPFVGTGYMNFWSGERLAAMWLKTESTIQQVHNGYLEQYLNLGYFGVTFIVIIMLSGLLKVKRYLNVDYSGGVLRLSFIVAAALYNYTEASFYGINNTWFLLLLGIIEIRDHAGYTKLNSDDVHQQGG